MNNLKNRIDCHNEMTEYINAVAPLAIDVLKNQPPKFKSGHSLYKKTKDSVDVVTGKFEKPKRLSCWVTSSLYSDNYVQLNVKSSYMVGEYSCEYMETTVYIWESGYELKWEDRKLHNYDDVINVQNQMKEINKQIEELEKQRSDLKTSVYPIL